MSNLIDIVQRLKLVNDYDQCKHAMNDAVTEIQQLRKQVAEVRMPQEGVGVEDCRDCWRPARRGLFPAGRRRLRQSADVAGVRSEAQA